MSSKQVVPLIGLCSRRSSFGLVAAPTTQLVGCAIAGIVAAAWLDRVSPGHRSTRLGRPRLSWLGVVLAPPVVLLLALPLLGAASIGVVMAVFLAGLMFVSARNDYGRTSSM
jgi:hypothetical protein